MLIDGALAESSTGAGFDNINPATEEVIGQTADATAADMDRAIGAARRAFDETGWSTDRALRQRCLRQLHEAIVAEQELFRPELVAEVGTPVMVTYLAQLDAPLEEGLLWPAEQIDHFTWERPLPDSNAFGQPSWQKVVKEPVGVVGAILPWNYPFEIIIAKLGQALATGNTMVIKPAPDTPWSATRIGRLIAEHTDIPAGIVNIVPSSDHLIGEQLVTDPRVDMISFTGSTAIGRRIMAPGAPTLKRLFLELGGKSADIILDDGDVADQDGLLRLHVHARRPGLRHADPHPHPPVPLRRGRRAGQGGHGGRDLRRPHRSRRHPGTPGQRQAAGPGPRLHRQGPGRGGPPGHRRRPTGPPARRATSSSPPSSPTWTTP